MYEKIKSISGLSLCKHKATPLFKINHSAFLEHHACARLDFALWKTIAPQGVRNTNSGIAQPIVKKKGSKNNFI
jgi:hypothetical protein